MSRSGIWLAMLVAFNADAALPTRFAVTDLGLANGLGGQQSGALAVNSAGQVAGYFEATAETSDLVFNGDLRAVSLLADGQLSGLPAFGLSGDETSTPLQNYAHALNTSGQVAGYGQAHLGDGVYGWQAFYSQGNEWLTLLGQWDSATKLPAANYFSTGNQEHRLLGNNDAGLMVGSVLANDGQSSSFSARPLLVNPAVTPIELRSLQIPAAAGQDGSLAEGWAYDINNAQQVVGWIRFDSEHRQGFIYDFSKSADHAAPQVKRILSLNGDSPVELRAINDQGWVTGVAAAGDGSRHAVLFDAKTAVSDQLLPAAADIHDATVAPLVADKNQFSQGLAINSVGDVVGTFRISSAPDRNHAFYYSRAEDKFIDLNTLIDAGSDGIADWTLISATGVTDPDATGQVSIVGIGQHRLSGQALPVARAFRLTSIAGTPTLPVEVVVLPSVSSGGGGSSGLLGGILLGLVVWRRQRRR